MVYAQFSGKHTRTIATLSSPLTGAIKVIIPYLIVRYTNGDLSGKALLGRICIYPKVSFAPECLTVVFHFESDVVRWWWEGKVIKQTVVDSGLLS